MANVTVDSDGLPRVDGFGVGSAPIALATQDYAAEVSAGFVASVLVTVEVTATADGTGTGSINDAVLAAGPLTSATVLVAVTSANANHIVTLPSPFVPGFRVVLINGATGYELRTTDPATIGINGGTGADAESAIAANTIVTATTQSAANWVAMSQVTAGTVSATQAAAP